MRTATAHKRHRAHHIRREALPAWILAIALIAAACSGSLPRPPATQVATDDYVAVPFSPRVPPVEFIPPAPSKDAVWVDGSWEWAGNRYGWRYGSWVVPPSEARHARWVVVRREADGQLFFAPSSWKDASGKTMEDTSFVNALGPSARARSRLGATTPAGGPTGPGQGRRPDIGTDTEETRDTGDSDD
jgi:hypothetical protein